MSKKLGINAPQIGVVGYPNVGKSALINALSKKGSAKVSSTAGTTKGIQWIKAGGLKVIDSPGVVPFEDREIDLGILGAKNPEKIKRKDKVAWKIIQMFIDYDINVLKENYQIDFEGKEVDEILEEIGRKKGYLLKGGRIDENRTAIQIVKDWQKGKLRL